MALLRRAYAAGGVGLAGGAIRAPRAYGGAVIRGAQPPIEAAAFAGVGEAGSSAAMSPLRRAAAASGRALARGRKGRAEGLPDWRAPHEAPRLFRHGVRLLVTSARAIMVAKRFLRRFVRKESAETHHRTFATRHAQRLKPETLHGSKPIT